MKEITGKYGTAKIFTDMVEDAAIEQVQTLMDCEFISGQQVRMMPDIHAGAGCTIGTTIKLTNKAVCPNLVGVDIGCGMLATNFGPEGVDLPELDRIVHEQVPAGFNIRSKPLRAAYELDWDYIAPVNKENALRSLGTLGGGNHFIELDRSVGTDEYSLVIHSGSRHLGLEIANYYQKRAIEQCKSNVDTETLRKKIIEEYKATGREKEIGAALARVIPKKSQLADDLCYVTDELYRDYIHDMKMAQRYAAQNRRAMRDVIVKSVTQWQPWEEIDSVHNFINMSDMILRKGATSANYGEKLLIPINMRDGTLVCKGRGNTDWNCSAPHGAGRLIGRKQALRQLSMDEYQKTMEGIYTTSVSQATLDESPMAYKPIENILDNIDPTAEVISVLKPVYNFKAADGPDSQKRTKKVKE